MPQQTNPLITGFPGGLSGLNGTTYQGGVYALIVNATTTGQSLLGGSPVGFDGTIDSIQIINGDTIKGTLVFSKNGTDFATLVKNGTAGAVTGTPIGNVTFTKTDVVNVRNAQGDNAEVIVHFH